MDTHTAKTEYELLMDRRNFLGALVALALPLPIGMERKELTYFVFENIPLEAFEASPILTKKWALDYMKGMWEANNKLI